VSLKHRPAALEKSPKTFNQLVSEAETLARRTGTPMEEAFQRLLAEMSQDELKAMIAEAKRQWARLPR